MPPKRGRFFDRVQGVNPKQLELLREQGALRTATLGLRPKVALLPAP